MKKIVGSFFVGLLASAALVVVIAAVVLTKTGMIVFWTICLVCLVYTTGRAICHAFDWL